MNHTALSVQGNLQKASESIVELQDQVLGIFGDLSVEVLNWKSHSDSWSIAQCLDHIIVSNERYFPILRKAMKSKDDPGKGKKLKFFPSYFGKSLMKAVSPDSQSKLRAPKLFKPSAKHYDKEIIDAFLHHEDNLNSILLDLSELDLDHTLIHSPVSRLITFSLSDGIEIILAHQKRHVNQAKAVKIACQLKKW